MLLIAGGVAVLLGTGNWFAPTLSAQNVVPEAVDASPTATDVQTSAWIEIGKTGRRGIRTGDALPNARLADGSCEPPSYEVGMRGDVESISTRFNEATCSLAVVDIVLNPKAVEMNARRMGPRRASPLMSPSAFEVRSSAVVRGIVYFEVLTRARTSVKFWNDNVGGPVYGGWNPWHDCYAWSPTTWVVFDCIHLGYSLSGPSRIDSNSYGEFENTALNYWLDSYSWAAGWGYETGTDRFSANCLFSGNPPATYKRCELWWNEI